MKTCELLEYKTYCILNMASRDIELSYPIVSIDDFRKLVRDCQSSGWIDNLGKITYSGDLVRIRLAKKLKLRGVYQSVYPDFTQLYPSKSDLNAIYLP